jgi:hypothetical protein
MKEVHEMETQGNIAFSVENIFQETVVIPLQGAMLQIMNFLFIDFFVGILLPVLAPILALLIAESILDSVLKQISSQLAYEKTGRLYRRGLISGRGEGRRANLFYRTLFFSIMYFPISILVNFTGLAWWVAFVIVIVFIFVYKTVLTLLQASS